MFPIIYQTNFYVPKALDATRIVSLVPSQTELLHDLGLRETVVGITKFCIHPVQWFKQKARVGGTKNVNIETVKALQPSLILANKEENVKEQIEALATICTVYVSDITSFNDAIEMICQVGILVDAEMVANQMITNITYAFQHVKHPQTKRNTAYLIWRNPYMAAGGETYINTMLNVCGFENVFKDTMRYPEITIEKLQLQNCDLVLLSSEPYPFKKKHIKELQDFLPNTEILLVDGEMFSWYGSRLLHAADYFNHLIERL